MASQTNKQPIFPLYPLSVTRHSEVSPISTLQTSISSGEVEELYACSEPQGIVVNRIRVTLTTNDGQTNTPMFIVVCLFNELDQSTWQIYQTRLVPAVTVSFNGAVAPASVVFEFDGGLCLKDSFRIGIARSVRDDTYDDLHITMEAGRYINDQS